MDRLLDSYDVVVVGTGISEAMLSSALARARSSVLHLDANSYYGDVWSTKSLTEFVLWLSRTISDDHAGQTHSEGAVTTVHLQLADVSVISQDWFWAPRLRDEMEVNMENAQQEQARPDIRGDRPSRISLQQLVNQNRRFNLDISPKLTYGRSVLMDLLHRTGLGFYSDIQRVGRSLHLKSSGRLVSLPMEPGAVDNWPKLADSERRALSIFLHWCRQLPGTAESDMQLDQQEQQEQPEQGQQQFQVGLQSKTLDELLDQADITSQLAKALVIDSYAMCQPSTGAEEGVRRIQRYLRSLPDEAESPLSWVHYGSNEIAEVFCRHSAVWGTTFILRRGVDTVEVENNRVTRVALTGGERVAVRHLVLNARHAPAQWLDVAKLIHVARAVFITDAPLRAEVARAQDAELNRGAKVTFFTHRIEGHRHLARVIELPTSTKACPPDTWVVHMTLPLAPEDAGRNPREVFQRLGELLFAADEDDASRPHALLSAYFVVKDYSEAVKQRSPNLPENVHLVPGADSDIDFDCSVRSADETFRRMCPGKHFLPTTPPHSMSESPLNIGI